MADSGRGLPGEEIRVFSGASGDAKASTRNHAHVTMVEVRLQPHATFRQELPAGYNGFMVVLEGSGVIGASATPVHSGQVARLSHDNRESAIAFAFAAAEELLRAILIAGAPLRESAVAHGPFVMNSEADIQQAFADFRQQGGSFGLD